MDFKNAKELLELCQKQNLPISEIMLRREMTEGEMPEEEARSRMARALAIMKESAHTPIQTPVRSMGGLIGGEAKLVDATSRNDLSISLMGAVQTDAVARAMAVLERSATMGVIVAAPTAGSAGVVPGCVLALADHLQLDDEQVMDALYCAAAIGLNLATSACVAGAEGGCQAEVGIASAMAASAAVELMGGNPQQCLDAASTVLMNMLGLVCDPVGGLVEYPCQNRNAAGVANALIAAELSLSGIRQLIPFDQMLEAMWANACPPSCARPPLAAVPPPPPPVPPAACAAGTDLSTCSAAGVETPGGVFARS